MTFALLTAVAFGATAVIVKRLTEAGLSVPVVAWAQFAFAAPILVLAGCLWGGGVRGPIFWGYAAAGVVGNAVATLAYFRAIRLSSLSVAMPLISLTPLWMFVTSRVMLGEIPTIPGAAGVLAIVGGVYAIGAAEAAVSKRRADLFAPLRALFCDAGARSATFGSVVWAVTSNIDKLALSASDPFTWAAIFTVAMAIVLTPFVPAAFRGRRRFPPSGQAAVFVPLFLLGLAFASMALFQLHAVERIPVQYVIAVKRAGLLAGVFVAVLRREPGLGYRVAGGGLVLAGLVGIAAGG